MSDTAIARPAESRGPLNLAARVLIAALLLFIEKFLLNGFVDTTAVHTATGMGEYIHEAQHWGFRFLVTFGAAMALFAFVQGDERLKTLNTLARAHPIRWHWLAVHIALLVPLAELTFSFYGNHGLQWPITLLAVSWLLISVSSIAALFTALAPGVIWRAAVGALGTLWLYAAVVGAVAASVMQLSQSLLWAPTTRITFELVDRVLRPLIPTLHSNPATQVLDTGRFAVQISELCSGLEGAGLLLAFCCAWLLYFRREYYFPRALILIPAGLALLFILNIVRIAVLVLIGHAGYPDIALFGFHSQAGWIAFNGTACLTAYLSRRSRWLNRTTDFATTHSSHNATVPYLLPLVTLLAAGMLSRAASGKFETLYPLRLLATAAALWYCLPKLRDLDWRFSWRGVATGIGVFVLWLAAAQWLTRPSPMPAALAALPPSGRAFWIAARAAAAVITVPLAEELAYRGYLLRRLKRADFESVRFGAVGVLALLISSFIFGLAHSGWWLPGTAAGLLYGLVLMRTGRLGEAVAAHATTNGLIAIWVLGLEQWQLW